MGRERSCTICASSEEEYLNILKQKDSEKNLNTLSPPKRKRSRLSSMIDEMENSPKKNQKNFDEENFNLEFSHNEKDNYNCKEENNENKNKDYCDLINCDKFNCDIINCECICHYLQNLPQEDLIKENDEFEEYSMLKENFKFEVKIVLFLC